LPIAVMTARINQLLKPCFRREELRREGLRDTARPWHVHIDEFLNFTLMRREHEDAICQKDRCIQAVLSLEREQRLNRFLQPAPYRGAQWCVPK
jgi:hypothetical protein